MDQLNLFKPQLYKQIPSCWSEDIFEVYDEAVATAPVEGVLVEVGSFWGKSAAYLAEAAKLANKQLKVYCVDLWGETPQNNPPMFDLERYPNSIEPRVHAEHNGSIFETFAYHLEQTRLSPDPLRVMRMASLEAAILFEAVHPLHFVYLDGDHDYEYVSAELEAWEPLVRRNGGIIAGHDYTQEFSGVIRATKEFFREDELKVQGKSWIVRL